MADPGALTEGILETFATALQRGDGETAEGAIAQAIEDGVPAAMVHDEVIEPALRRLAALSGRGEIDASAERLAMGIARRVLATLRRYMLSGEAQDGGAGANRPLGAGGRRSARSRPSTPSR